jgi:hypothetical protein
MSPQAIAAASERNHFYSFSVSGWAATALSRGRSARVATRTRSTSGVAPTKLRRQKRAYWYSRERADHRA